MPATRGRFDALLAGCTGPDDPTYRAAELLSAAWEPALDFSFQLGYDSGYRRGYGAAERDMAERWHRVYLTVSQTLTGPRHAELSAIREARIDTPCPARCERCSRCACAAAAAENLAHYKTPDFPDAATRAALVLTTGR